MYDTILGVWYRLVEQTVNADNDVLLFNQTPIIHIDIIYGDSSQGDILTFIDSFGNPKKLNIERAISGGYGQIKAAYLDVAKEPASIPPSVVYERDPSNAVNSLRKKLFRFKIRWVFDDQDKSVTSSQSEMPIPWNSFDQSYDSDPTNNCRIAITYQTGPANVKKIEILGAVSIGNVLGDFFLIEAIDKSVSGLSDNDISTFLFYNNKAYNYIEVQESIQLFDYVPIKTQAQTLLNGNVLSYGNITEGYPNLTNFTFGGQTSNISAGSVLPYYGNTFSDFITSQSGDSGFGSGNIHIIVRGLIIAIAPSLDTYTVYMTDGSTISYTLNNGDDAAAVIEGLRIDAISKGYTIISNGSNDLIVFKANISLARSFIISNYAYVGLFGYSLNAYDWLSSHGWGLVYYDPKGRTNGVIYTDGFSVNAPAYNESGAFALKPTFNASIFHIPPEWAAYFHWVQTKDLKKSAYIQWISDRTYKDNTVTTGMIRYAYISIESLNVFIRQNSGTPLGYTFKSGDRITFFKRFNSDNSTANLYGNSKDFEIISTEQNPTINGQERTGQFIKIILPATDGSFDFGDDFNNYFIELYTPAQSVENGLNVYYEYGQRYKIGNAGQNDRFHQGQLQNQTSDYSQPATFEFINGDNYIRTRSVQTGNVFTYNVVAGGGEADRVLIGMNFISQTYDDPNITTQSVPLTDIDASFNPTSDSRWILKAITWTTFRMRGTIYIQFTTSKPGDFWQIFLQNRYGEINFFIPPFDAGEAKVYSFTFDEYVTLEDDRIFLQASSIGFGSRPLAFLASEITFTIDKTISQVMVDPNFSDYFPSAINSNGRSLIYDVNANQVTYPVMYRWSLDYQADTNVNQSNRFYPQNLDNVDRRFGAIKRMMTWDKMLTFFQERKCGQAGVYQKFISDNSGGQQLITTTSIISENNVQYYAGNFGVANQPDSVVQSGYVYYFVDPIKGKQLRLSRDGITDLSESYKTQTWAARTISPYLSNKNYTFGGNARITGTFNVRKDNVGEYLCVLQPWTIGMESFPGETMAFDEVRNCFTSLYDFAPEQIICAENVLYSFRNGKMYIHDVVTGGGMNKFYGTYYDPTITRIFNAGLVEKKSLQSITEVASTKWDCPSIITNSMSYGTTPQQSNLVISDFEDLESNFSAAFLGDINSIGGLYGDVLKGNLIKIKFRAPNATSSVTLSAVNLYFIDSPFTNK